MDILIPIRSEITPYTCRIWLRNTMIHLSKCNVHIGLEKIIRSTENNPIGNYSKLSESFINSMKISMDEQHVYASQNEWGAQATEANWPGCLKNRELISGRIKYDSLQTNLQFNVYFTN